MFPFNYVPIVAKGLGEGRLGHGFKSERFTSGFHRLDSTVMLCWHGDG